VRPERRGKLSSRQLYAARVATILLAGSISSVFGSISSVFQALIGQAKRTGLRSRLLPFLAICVRVANAPRRSGEPSSLRRRPCSGGSPRRPCSVKFALGLLASRRLGGSDRYAPNSSDAEQKESTTVGRCYARHWQFGRFHASLGARSGRAG
jgi:hypothetical protein